MKDTFLYIHGDVNLIYLDYVHNFLKKIFYANDAKIKELYVCGNIHHLNILDPFQQCQIYEYGLLSRMELGC